MWKWIVVVISAAFAFIAALFSQRDQRRRTADALKIQWAAAKKSKEAARAKASLYQERLDQELEKDAARDQIAVDETTKAEDVVDKWGRK